MRSPRFAVCLLSFAALALAACASSTPGGAPDAETGPPIDGPSHDAMVDAAPPDACVGDPDGETCNGTDDDCDGEVDEGFAGVGEPCELGVGACQITGSTVCTKDGTSTECDGDVPPPGDELCGNGDDDDCDGATDEGFPSYGQPCSVGTGQCFATGVYICAGDGLSTVCDATAGSPQAETCNGLDDDCDGAPDNGFQINQPCDGGGDSDLCAEGVWVCDGAGGRTCTDMTGSTFDLCGGGDDDCDPTSGDGSEDGAVGQACDGGADTDLCLEGVQVCSNGALQCTDATGSTTDNCGGGDEDCDASSADGSEHPGRGAVCDGGDTDLCVEGTMQCSGTTLACNDSTSSTVDLCGNGNEDCDAASADGSEDPGVGVACDGPGDTDVCAEAISVCSGGAISCPDGSSSTAEACNGDAVDENCNGQVDEGWGRDDNPTCTTPFNLGAIDGDTGAQTLTDTWYDEEFVTFTLRENNDSDVYLSATVRLYSPPGVDFDLYLKCGSCSGGIVQQSTVSSLAGHYDYLNIRWDDDWFGEDDTYPVVVEVRHKQSNRCAYWQLLVTGNTTVTTNTCNP